MQGAGNSGPPSVTKFQGNKPTKYIVLKSGNQNPVVTKVIRPSAPTAGKVNVTQTLATTNANAPTSINAAMVSTRRAYERHGTEDFLKRFTAGGSVKVVTKGSDGGKAESGATTVKKTTKPSPTQINIFSALDEELSNPKKKEPPKKLVPKIELSRTYQPPAKSLVIQPPPPVIKSQDSKENEDESLFDKIGKTKDNWLLDFSGSPTKCPVKPGGSIVDLSDDSSDDNFPVECKVQLARVIPKPEMQSSPGAEKQKPDSSGVVNISSSSDVDEPGDERKDPNFEQAGDDASLASESDDASEASTKGSKEREVGKRRSESGNSEKELSFVEARSRRKRKPPTYFGYEDHELSYNLGLNLVMNPQGQDETDSSMRKKKEASGAATASVVSKRKGRSSRRSGTAGDSDDDDCKSTSSDQSLKRALQTFDSESSDEEVLNTLVKRERSQRGGTVDNSSTTAASSHKTSTESDDVKTTAFRLYYKDVLDSVQSDETDTDKITRVITQMWFGLDKSQREKFEKQARQLSQISLPPSPHKNSTGSNEDKSSNKEKMKIKKSKEAKSEKRSDGSKEEPVGILSKVAADLQSATDDSNSDSKDSSTSSEDGSPVIKSRKKKSLKASSSPPPKPKYFLPSSTDSSGSELESSDSSVEQAKKKRSIMKTTNDERSHTSMKTKPTKPTKTPAPQPVAPKKEPELPKVCFNCPKESIECSLWSSDGRYCSISCCVLYSKKLFNDWVVERKRKLEIEREQNEIEELKHAKDFFCIETEEIEPENDSQISSAVMDKPEMMEIKSEQNI